MLADGDSAKAIGEAYPQLSKTQIELAAFFAKAYPGGAVLAVNRSGIRAIRPSRVRFSSTICFPHGEIPH